MMYCSDFKRAKICCPSSFGPIPIGRVDLSIDLPPIRWMREQMRDHGTVHIPDVRAQKDFPRAGFLGAGALGWPYPFVSKVN